MSDDDFGKTQKTRLMRAAFCREYVANDFNGEKAAIRAGYSKRSAKVTASRLLTDANVKQRIAEYVSAQESNHRITQERIVELYEHMATVDASDLYDEAGEAIPLKKLPKHVRMAVKEVKRNKDGSIDYILWPKDKALEALAKYRKMFVDRIEHSGTINLADVLAETCGDGEKPTE